MSSLELWHPGLCQEGVARALRQTQGVDTVLANLARLVVLEQRGQAAWRSSFLRAVTREEGGVAALVLGQTEGVLTLLTLVPPGEEVRLAELHKLCHALVQVLTVLTGPPASD